MTTQAERILRQKQWAEYHRWAETEALSESESEQSIANIGALLEWMPESTRTEERDPEKLGVQ